MIEGEKGTEKREQNCDEGRMFEVVVPTWSLRIVCFLGSSLLQSGCKLKPKLGKW